jgi:hypothetical protein
MKPIFIILYAVIITLALTLVFARPRQANPTARRFFWIAVLVGGVALLVITALALVK